jgi:hypothetical protein
VIGVFVEEVRRRRGWSCNTVGDGPSHFARTTLSHPQWNRSPMHWRKFTRRTIGHAPVMCEKCRFRR